MFFGGVVDVLATGILILIFPPEYPDDFECELGVNCIEVEVDDDEEE